jgi:hypothetical protein
MPVIPFWYAIVNFKLKQYHFFILAFAFLAGYGFTPGSGSDGEVYTDLFNEFRRYDFAYYIKQIAGTYSNDSGLLDIYSTSLLFLVSRFTANPAFFFAVAGLIYYFFFLKLIYLIRTLIPVKKLKYFLPFFLGCVFIFDLFLGINGIRFALAFVIFAYGALLYLMHNTRSGLLIALSSILIHFSLFYSFLFLILFIPLKKINVNVLVYIIVLIGFVFAEFFVGSINKNLNFSNDAYEQRVTSYTSETYIETRETGFKERNSYLQLDSVATYYFVIICFLITKIPVFRIRFDRLANKLFSFSALMLIHNFISAQLIDTGSNRYYLLVIFFILIYLLYLFYLNQNRTIFKAMTLIYLPILILHVLVILRTDTLVISPFSMIGNLFLVFFIN